MNETDKIIKRGIRQGLIPRRYSSSPSLDKKVAMALRFYFAGCHDSDSRRDFKERVAVFLLNDR